MHSHQLAPPSHGFQALAPYMLHPARCCRWRSHRFRRSSSHSHRCSPGIALGWRPRPRIQGQMLARQCAEMCHRRQKSKNPSGQTAILFSGGQHVVQATCLRARENLLKSRAKLNWLWKNRPPPVHYVAAMPWLIYRDPCRPSLAKNLASGFKRE